MCHTQQEIAEAVDLHKDSLPKLIEECCNLESFPKSSKLLATFQDAEFELPAYNIWSYGKKTNEVSHFGNSEQRILLNAFRYCG